MRLPYIVSLAFAAGTFLHVSGEARAQDICDLGKRVVEILSTIDACAATDSQFDKKFLRQTTILNVGT